MPKNINLNKIQVSIIIPTFNRQKSLIRTLDSLFTQTFPQENFEIIIVNDGSTDDTEKIVLDFKKNHQNISYIKQSNKGIASARNQGIINSKGDIVGFTDDDCIVDSFWIQHAVESLKNTGKNITYCGVQGKTLPESIIEQKKLLFHYVHAVENTGKEKYRSYQTCNIFYWKKYLIEISCFDEQLKYGSDDDIAFRLIKKGYKIHFDENILVYHEVRYQNLLTFIFKKLIRDESLPLYYKKNPEYKDRIFFKIFARKSHVYPIFAIGTVLMYTLNYEVSIPLFFTIFAFLASRVFVDRNYKMMPIRLLLFWRYFLIDFASVYYVVRGSIKHRYLLI
ncbi:MAG: glycosyltransferase [Methanosarcinales archaeon]|nr:glycosyltransferase [Methanosarcinales archaeon]MCD4810617.1 glycosyltransferase [Methanosarcinales archaeon]